MARTNRIRELMHREDIRSLRELGRQLGVSDVTLSLLVRGKTQPSVRTLDLFHERFPTYNIDWLFPRATEPPRQPRKPRVTRIPRIA